MPKRDLANDLGTSESLSRVSIEAAFTFVTLTSVADDFGRFDGRLRILLARLYPLREEVTEAALTRWIDELEGEGLVHRYTDLAGLARLHLPGWFRHQRNRDSDPKYDAPPCCGGKPRKCSGFSADRGEPADTRGYAPQLAASRGELPQSAARARALRPPTSVLPASVSPTTDQEEEDPPLPPRKRGVSRGPTDPPERLTDEQRGALRAWCGEKRPDLVASIDDIEEACLDYFRSRGKRHRDWLATVRTWVRKTDAPRLRSPAGRQEQRAAQMADNVRHALALSEERERAKQREREGGEARQLDADVRDLRPGGERAPARGVHGHAGPLLAIAAQRSNP